MARKATILCRVADHRGEIYDVREIRPTPHGFEVFIGWPVGLQRGQGGGGPKIILTQPLAEHLLKTKLSPKDANLPISRNVLKRLRSELFLNWRMDKNEWWEENPEGPGEKASTKSVRRKKMGLPSTCWTPEEDQRLVALRETGWSCSVIAEKMGKTPHAIEMRIYRLRKKGVLA